MLAQDGRIVFTNIATGNPFRVWIEYMGDWKLIERSEEDVATLCGLAGVPPPVMMRDATSLAIVATVKKDHLQAAGAELTPTYQAIGEPLRSVQPRNPAVPVG